jgi:hypothetical protein
MDQILQVVTLNAIFGSNLLECGLCWDDNGDGLRLVRGRVDTNVCDYGCGTIDRFELHHVRNAKFHACLASLPTFSRAMYSPFRVFTKFFLRSMMRI